MSKEKLVIIGANSFQNKLIERAKEKGYETHVFAWECGDIGERTADYFYPISITEKEEILEVCKGIRPAGVCSIASDLAVTTVNYVASALGLTCNSSRCGRVATDKYEMRKVFREHDLPIPQFCHYTEDMIGNLPDIENFHFPLIVKPTDRSGSRGVSKINSISELENALKYALEESFSKCAIIEEYVGGTEYSIEYISYEGEHHLLAVTRKFTTGHPHFVELAHYQPAVLPEDVDRNLRNILETAFDALNIRNGASHSEVKIMPDGTINIIEIGARMGGDCIGSDLVKISTGYDYVEQVIDIACGKPLEMRKCREPKVAFARFLLNRDDVEKMNRIREEHPEWIYEITIEEDVNDEHLFLTSSADRPGYYILELNNREELERIYRYVIDERHI